MKEEIVKRLPCKGTDIPEIECWLDQMALEGNFLADAEGRSWHFKKEEPKGTRYRLDAVSKKESGPSDEKLEDYRLLGWEYVLTYGRWYHIFRSDDPQAEELHTDQVVESYAFKRLESSLLITSIILIPLLVLQWYFIFGTIVDLVKYPVLSFMNFNIENLCYMLIVTLIWWCSFAKYRSFRQLRKSLGSGEVMKPSGELVLEGKRKWKKYFLPAFVLLVLALQFSFIPNKKDLNEAHGLKSLPTLDALKLGAAETDGSEAVMERSYTTYHNLLMKNKYKLQEEPETARYGVRGGPSLNAYYYEPKDSLLVKPLYRDLVKRYAKDETGAKESELTLLSHTGFDECIVSEGNGYQILAAREGSRILVIQYTGPGSLKAQAGILFHIVNTSA